MAADDVEIARQEGTEFRSVRLQVQADGAIRLHAYDMGPTAKLTFGRDEYEFWVTIPPAEVAKLAGVLLKEKFGGRLQAVTELRDFCSNTRSSTSSARGREPLYSAGLKGDMMRNYLLSITLATAALVTTANADEWREVDPENLVVMDTNYGRVLIELAPDFAPKHAERFRALVRAKFYDNKSFYRVIDGFVAQGGIGEGDDKKTPEWPPLTAEFDAKITGKTPFIQLGSPDLFAKEVGHIDGFPVGRDWDDGRMWLLHCPGTVAMARDTDPNTGGTEFYIPIGHAPRRLDRNLTAFGRVLEGMQYVQKLNRGDPKVDSGVIKDEAKRDPILKVRMAADIDAAERPRIQVMDTTSKAFEEFKAQRRNPAPDFYKRVAKNLDICAFNAPVQHPGEKAASASPPPARTAEAAPPPAPAPSAAKKTKRAKPKG